MELIRQVQIVVVAMHAYGGLVGSEIVPEYLSYPKRQSLNLSGGVIHLFYINGYILNGGQSVPSAFGESSNSDVHIRLFDSAPR